MHVLPSFKNISTARILHDVCPKNIFSPEFGGQCPPALLVSYAYGQWWIQELAVGDGSSVFPYLALRVHPCHEVAPLNPARGLQSAKIYSYQMLFYAF